MVGQAAPASPYSCHSICLIAALLLCGASNGVRFFVKKKEKMSTFCKVWYGMVF